MKNHQKFAAITVMSAAALAGCASPSYNDPGANYYPQSAAPAYNAGYGVIDSIQVVQQQTGNDSGIGAGAVVGGVVGGVLGNQIGNGSGRTAATAVGVVGGALVGNQIQRNNQQAQVREVYQVGIRLDNGAYQTTTLDSVGDLRVGNRVRLDNGRVYRY